MSDFSVWRNLQEQWDAVDIDPPILVVAAQDFRDAAIQAATDLGLDAFEGQLIVRDESTGRYYEVELSQRWGVCHTLPRTLEELCEP